jgi:hypothetical protein
VFQSNLKATLDSKTGKGRRGVREDMGEESKGEGSKGEIGERKGEGKGESKGESKVDGKGAEQGSEGVIGGNKVPGKGLSAYDLRELVDDSWAQYNNALKRMND